MANVMDIQRDLRLVKMGIKAGLFAETDTVDLERGIMTVDAYLGIVDEEAPGPKRVQ